MKEFPRPQTVKQVKGFLGLANFYRRHIPRMAELSRPLTELTRKDLKEFVWTQECEEAFEEVKRQLVTAPLLHPPDLDKEFFLWTDASIKGFGAVLEQKDDGGDRHLIAYASRATNTAEQKYAPTELEVAALVFALEHFQVYLLGNQVTVFADHQALVSAYIPYLKSQTKGLLARWYLRLSPFLPNLTLEHKAGTSNQAADALSRSPVSQDQVLHIKVEDSGTTMHKVQASQRDDPALLMLIEYLERQVLPEDQVAAKKVVAQAVKGFYLLDGILYFEDSVVPGRRHLVVPSQLRRKLLLENHSAVFAGHCALKKLMQRVNQYYYWPGMKAEAHQVCQSCVTCLSTQGYGRRSKPPLQCIEVSEPFECIGMDIKEFDMSTKGNRYALVFQDYLTKWPEVYPIPNHQASTVADCLADLIWRHGVPSRIIHDRVPEFLSDILQDAAAVFRLEQLPTSGGHPQTDGLVERLNRTLKAMLTKVVNKKGSNWDTKLGPVLMAYRTTPQSSTGVSPFYLLYGRDAKLPSAPDFYVPKPPAVTVESDYGRELFQELKEARELARQSIKNSQGSQKMQYDKHAREPEIKVGDLVMLKVDPKFKLDRAFRGPYRVHQVTSTCACIQPVNRPDQEKIFVSLQRLSCCERGASLDEVQPWLGHGYTRKRRQVRTRKVMQSTEATHTISFDEGTVAVKDDQGITTRKGRRVVKPARYRDPSSFPEGSASQQGEVVRHVTSRVESDT